MSVTYKNLSLVTVLPYKLQVEMGNIVIEKLSSGLIDVNVKRTAYIFH